MSLGERRKREIRDREHTQLFQGVPVGLLLLLVVCVEGKKMITGREADQERLWRCFVLRWQKQQHFCVLVEKLQEKRKKMKKGKENK